MGDFMSIFKKRKLKFFEKYNKLDFANDKIYGKKVITMALVVVFLLILSGTSYAILTMRGKGGINTLTSGTLFLTLSNESNAITLSGAQPLPDDIGMEGDTYSFSLTNNGSIRTYYEIRLNNTCQVGTSISLNNETVTPTKCIPNNYIKTGIKVGTSDYKIQTIGTNEVLTSGYINQGDTLDIKLKVWLSNDTPNEYQSTNGNIVVYSGTLALYSKQEEQELLAKALLGENNQNVVTTGDGLYKEEYTPSSELSSIYQSNLSNGKLTTYYYKGTNVNNYVSFAGLTWRVIRINEDGSIRLILNDHIGKTNYFNIGADSYTYMYYSNSDVTDGIKNTVDSFYNSNLSSYANYIEETTFCEEAKVKFDSSYTAGSAEMVTKEEYTPSFNCKTDLNGKGILSLNAGLVTIDEYLKSGGIFYNSSGTSNTYLAYSLHYWTMSPAGYGGSSAHTCVWQVNISNWITFGFAGSTGLYVRPVISLKADTKVTSGADGSIDNAYQIS